MRESLFSILTARSHVIGMSVLDLYAGSGALGLEALSRGASSALFVESDQRSAAVITGNVAALGLPGATVRHASVSAVLAAGTNSPVELVFADPPYATSAAELEAVLIALNEHGWASAETLVVIERAARGAPLVWPSGWYAWQPRNYGDTRLEFAERTAD